MREPKPVDVSKHSYFISHVVKDSPTPGCSLDILTMKNGKLLIIGEGFVSVWNKEDWEIASGDNITSMVFDAVPMD